MNSRILIRTALMFSVSAASVSSAQATQPVIRDSSGVRIVEHATLKVARAPFAISETPRLSFGGLSANPSQEFTGGDARLMQRFSDDRILIEDKDHVKVYNAQGQFVRAIGRSGQGPGEFIQITTVCVVQRDTILVFERPNDVNVFDGAGNHRSTHTFGTGQIPDTPCFSDGSFLRTTLAIANPASRLPPDRARTEDAVRLLLLHRRDGSILDTIAVFPELVNPRVARTLSVTVRDSLIYINHGEPGFRVYTKQGRLVSIVRSRDPLEPVTAQTPGSAASARAGQPVSTAPQTIPAFIRVHVDNGGRVWLTRHPYNAQVTGMTVFSSSGDLIGNVAPLKLATETSSIVLTGFFGDDAVLLWRDVANGAFHVSSHPVREP